jgi:putative spermidine/putrescine transport system substrate-binding protein
VFTIRLARHRPGVGAAKRRVLLAALMSAMMASCAAPAASTPTEITLSVWGGNHEIILKSALTIFEQQNNAKVVYRFNDLPTRLTQLNAEKDNPTTDVAVVSIDSVPILGANGVVLPEDTSVPNYDKLVPSARRAYGYGTARLLTVLAWNTNKITQKPTSWNDLWRSDFAGHVALPVIPGNAGFSLLAMVAKLNGGDENNLGPAFDKLAQLKPIGAFITFFPSAEPQIKSDDIYAIADLAGGLQDFKNRGGPVDYIIPTEGSPESMNVAVITKGTRKLDLAKKLVGALIGPEVQLGYAAKLFYGTVNTSITLPPDLAGKIHPSADDNVVTLNWDAIVPQEPALLDRWNRQIVGH